MKKDKLQDRKLYTVGYSYDNVGFEYIRVGGNRWDYFTVRLRALEIFRKKYPNHDVKLEEMKIDL